MTIILVTGAAGFVGFHLSQQLLVRDCKVIGLDNLNSYYDVSLKQARLKQLRNHDNFSFYELNLSNREDIAQLFTKYKFDRVVHLAAQAGVRYSLENPNAYVDSNLVGFVNILEGCRHSNVEHLVFASSSSVYGTNKKIPFSTQDNVDHPISLYAATKKANELMAYTYSHLYQLPTTGLRFFTVYGPWGRPDMAYFLFAKAILAEEPIKVFNYGKMKRDFTYIDDIVEGVIRVMDKIPHPQDSSVPYKIYNIGNNQPVELGKFIEILENCLGKKAIKNYLPMQPGDVPITYADVADLIQDVGFQPNTPLEIGLEKFVTWYRAYYQ
ncbi:NAD-dependent epimerase [Crocosphaera sp. XPORK-15E]|uniref:NAD-dependent epimerase n=1 Tax=Crocosphaera sp. XPORK-15E TaxID=3110247 RepID=UPI002B2209F0|nr:NAD-dependent epimerase [Crocosphaera sp. XPORK-15E]MEA5532873.1 NAD-dependent epimerase [Crocosphaera sp. XPORK-15E]